MRKLSEINEGMWKSGLDRAKGNVPRLEKGIKVVTPLGETIYLTGHDTDVERTHKRLFNEYNNHRHLIDIYSSKQVGRDYVERYPDSAFYIDDENSRIISFFDASRYKNMIDNNISEEDYIEIIKSIANAFRKFKIIRGTGNEWYFLIEDKRIPEMFYLDKEKDYMKFIQKEFNVDVWFEYQQMIKFYISYDNACNYHNIVEKTNEFLDKHIRK